MFSSLSESGFIPTGFRPDTGRTPVTVGSHLFQRVASFLQLNNPPGPTPRPREFSSLSESGFIPTKDLFDVFRAEVFSSLSESGFIPTAKK